MRATEQSVTFSFRVRSEYYIYCVSYQAPPFPSPALGLPPFRRGRKYNERGAKKGFYRRIPFSVSLRVRPEHSFPVYDVMFEWGRGRGSTGRKEEKKIGLGRRNVEAKRGGGPNSE